MSKKVLKVGIAGFGRSGYGIHWRWLQHDEKFQVVAVADCLPERREDAVKEIPGVRIYEDYAELLNKEKELDLFVNATPSRFHVEASKMALELGNNLLSEKPSARTVAEFDELTAAAEKAGVMFYPFQNSRFYHYFNKIKEVIDSGRLGEIIQIRSIWSGFSRRWDWQTLQCEMGGNLLNTGPHPVDQAIALFGDGYPEVFCRMRSIQPLGGDAEDFCSITLYGENKPQIEILLSNYLAYPQGKHYNVSGSLGGLSGDHFNLEWKYYDTDTAPKQEMWEPWSKDRGYCSEQLSWTEESWKYNDESSSNAGGFTLNSQLLYANLYDVLVNGAEQVIKLDQVRRQIYVIEECHKQNPLPRKK
jgi:predicted dehydrogenase